MALKPVENEIAQNLAVSQKPLVTGNLKFTNKPADQAPQQWSYEDPSSYMQANLDPAYAQQIISQMDDYARSGGPGYHGGSGYIDGYHVKGTPSLVQSVDGPDGGEWQEYDRTIARQLNDGSYYYDTWSPDGTYTGRQGGGDSSWMNIREGGKVAAVIGGLMYGGAALAGEAGAGAGAGGLEMTNGAFLGEGVSSGVGAWDAAAIKSAVASGELGTAASYAGQNLANGTFTDTASNLYRPNSISTPNTGGESPPVDGGSGSWNGTDFSGTSPTNGGNGINFPSLDSNTVKAGLTLASTALDGGNSVPNGDLSQVKPGDLATVLNATGQQNWQNQLQASRFNSVTPDGSSSWSSSPQFNEAGYNSALQAWEAAGNPNLPKPTQEQFTSQQWTNTSSLNPQAQALADAQRQNQQNAANALPGVTQNYVDRASSGANRSGIPDYQYSANTQNQNQVDLGQRPSYDKISAPTSMGNPAFGDVTRGSLVSSADKTARDWAGQVGGRVDSWTDDLAAMDPFMFDQQGSDAMWGVSSRYLLPQQQAEKQAMEARLGEQGFVPGTPAYDNALKQMLDSQSLAQADARDRATLAGREFGNQAFDNRSGALNSAISGQLNLGNLGIATDKNMFDQNLANAQLSNSAQGQDFNQQLALSEQDFQEGLAANDVVKSLFGMNLDATNSNNKWASQDFQDLLAGTGANNSAIGANNDVALALAGLNNNAVNSARGQANADFNTDIAGMGSLFSSLNSAQGDRPVAPNAGQSNVPGAEQADLAKILQDYFGNNVDLANANTASKNARNDAIAQVIAAIFAD